MASIRVFMLRALDLVVGRCRDDRLTEEMQAHLDLLAEDYMAKGMSIEDARFAARRAFGGVDQMRSLHRDQRGFPSVDSLLQDVRFALRMLAKDRRFTLAAVTALGLGIGVTNTVFTIVNAALIRDVPFDEPDRLVALGTRDTRGRQFGMSYPDYVDVRQTATSFVDLAATTDLPANLSEEGRAPERLRGTHVSADTFGLLRSTPILGRDFLPEDEQPGAPAVVMLGYGIWQIRYGGDREIIGHAVRVNGVPSTIVGVMPPGFRFPFLQDLWQPLTLSPGNVAAKRDARTFRVFGRLADATDLPRAQAEVETISGRLAREFPDAHQGIAPTVTLLRDARPAIPQPTLIALAVAVCFVLLIACGNVANLLLAKAIQRSREIAIRTSLGATRWRIIRQLLIECVLVATLAGAVGLILSVYGVRLLGVAFDVIEAAAPGQSNTPFWVDLRMNGPVFLFLGVLCLATALGFGFVPAVHISKANANDLLKAGGRTATGSRHARRWTGAFVVAQIALTLMLLAEASLLIRSLTVQYRADTGIATSNLVTMRLTLPPQKYPDAERRKRFFEQLDERLAASPVVSSAAIASDIPLSWSPSASRQIWIEGRSGAGGDPVPTASYVIAGERYFETLGLRLLRGRAFVEDDGAAGREAAIVNQRFAAMFFQNEDPLGRRLQLRSTGAAGPSSPWLTIIGVAPTLPMFGPGPPEDPMVYAPLRAEAAPPASAAVIVRSLEPDSRHDETKTLDAVISALREEVRALDADQPLYSIETMDSTMARRRFPTRLMSTWFGMLALIAMMLAAVGLYAITAHYMAQHTKEIGVRMALGARVGDVVWFFARRTVLQLAIGLAIGLSGALAIGQLLQSFLGEVGPRDPIILTSVTLLLSAVSVASCYFPTRRAARLDPVMVLRDE
jgi:putative ABC transport system permease protein